MAATARSSGEFGTTGALPNSNGAMPPSHRCFLALVLTIGAAFPSVALGQPAKTQLRFRIASEGGFDQRGFVTAYGSALSGINFQMVSGEILGTGLEELQNGTADLTITVSQTAYAERLNTTTDRPDQLRAIANLGVVPLHFVARTDSGIRTIRDLRGRSVNVGVPTGENSRLAQSVLEAFGLGAGTYTPHHLPYSMAVAGLLSRKYEAMFIVGSYPGRSVLRATEGGVARLLSIEGTPVESTPGEQRVSSSRADSRRHLSRAEYADSYGRRPAGAGLPAEPRRGRRVRAHEAALRGAADAGVDHDHNQVHRPCAGIGHVDPPSRRGCPLLSNAATLPLNHGGVDGKWVRTAARGTRCRRRGRRVSRGRKHDHPTGHGRRDDRRRHRRSVRIRAGA